MECIAQYTRLGPTEPVSCRKIQNIKASTFIFWAKITEHWVDCLAHALMQLLSGWNGIGWNNQFHFYYVDNHYIGHNVPWISLVCFLCFSFPSFLISLKKLHDMCHMVNTMILSLMCLWLFLVNCTFTERKKKCQQFGKENYRNSNEKRFENHQKTLWKPQSSLLLCTKDLLSTK